MAGDPHGDFVVVWSGPEIHGQLFRAVIFADGFESGDLASWSSSVGE